MANSIFIKQDSKENQTLFYVIKRIQKLVRTLFVTLLITNTILPVILNVLLYFFSDTVLFIVCSVLSFGLIIFTEIVNGALINRVKADYALLFLKYDDNLFNLDIWDKSNDEHVQKVIEARLKDEKNGMDNYSIEELRCYNNYTNLKHPRAVYNCQRDYIEKEIKLGSGFFALLMIFISLFIIGFIVVAILLKQSALVVVTTLVNLMPIFVFFLSNAVSLNESNADIKNLNSYLAMIKKDIDSKEVVLSKDITLEMLLYDTRRSMYIVPTWYDRLRSKKIDKEQRKRAKRIRRKERKRHP